MGFSSHLLQVSFVEPVTVRNHTEYVLQVSMSGKTWQCQRRYRQFDELHSTLKRANKSIPIPSLPEKKWFGNMRPNFVQERLAGLQTYVDKLLLDSRWASMHILRAFFDTHRHMGGEDGVDGVAAGGAGGQMRGEHGENVINSSTNEADQYHERVQLEALERDEERLNAVVERAEELMVEIYAAPPVMDQTSAAEQVLGVEEALERRAEKVQSCISTYRDALSKILKDEEARNADEAGKESSDEAAAGGEEGDYVPKVAAPIVTQRERDDMYAQALLLVESFQVVEK